MENFKTVSIRKETYDYVDTYAYINNISKAQALDDMVSYFRKNMQKDETARLIAERKEDSL